MQHKFYEMKKPRKDSPISALKKASFKWKEMANESDDLMHKKVRKKIPDKVCVIRNEGS